LDRTARVWHAASGEAMGAPLRHQQLTFTVSWSPDATRVLSYGDGNSARMWDLATGQAVGAPLVHQRAVNVAAWSPDGTRIITGSRDGTARVWNADTGHPLGMPLRHDGVVTALAWSPDGNRVMTGSDDDTVRVWDVPVGTEADAQPLAEAAEVMSAYRVNVDGAMVPVHEAFVKLASIRKQINVGSPARGSIQALLKWALSDPLTRTISPFSEMTTDEYSRRMISRGPTGRAELGRTFPGHPALPR
jgi:WD40 repeat protein